MLKFSYVLQTKGILLLKKPQVKSEKEVFGHFRLDTSGDYSNFNYTSRNFGIIDVPPPRIRKLWAYFHHLKKQRDDYIIVTRNRVKFDLSLADSTLGEYLNETRKYRHCWTSLGKFQEFCTCADGQIMVIFRGFSVTSYGDIVNNTSELHGSIYRTCAKYAENHEEGYLKYAIKPLEPT